MRPARMLFSLIAGLAILASFSISPGQSGMPGQQPRTNSVGRTITE